MFGVRNQATTRMHDERPVVTRIHFCYRFIALLLFIIIFD